MSSSKKDNSRKRNKKFFLNNNSKKRKLEEFEPGLKGFLITCNDKKEAPAVSEAYGLLNEYADKLYGPEVNSNSAESHMDNGEDIEKSLADEISELKDKQIQRRFKSVKTKVKNVLFIKTTLGNPNELSDAIFSDLKKSKLKKTRHCMKFIPVLLTCKASVKSIPTQSKKVFEDFFQSTKSQSTYCIIFKSRCNNVVKRDEIIPDMSKMIHDLNEEWTVQYKNPDYTVFVNIVATVCTLSILKDFDGLCKYNVHSVTDEGAQESNKKELNKDGQTSAIIDNVEKIVKEAMPLETPQRDMNSGEKREENYDDKITKDTKSITDKEDENRMVKVEESGKADVEENINDQEEDDR